MAKIRNRILVCGMVVLGVYIGTILAGVCQVHDIWQAIQIEKKEIITLLEQGKQWYHSQNLERVAWDLQEKLKWIVKSIDIIYQ